MKIPLQKQLLFSVTKKDFDISWFSGTGAGGQHRNRHMNCCRMTHRDSGVTKTGQSNRSQQANKKEAFNAIVESTQFKLWLSRKTAIALEQTDGESVDDLVERAMKDVKVEVLIDDEWMEEE